MAYDMEPGITGEPVPKWKTEEDKPQRARRTWSFSVFADQRSDVLSVVKILNFGTGAGIRL
ncbi:hypothetical protein AGMMS50267_03340 [Spirochaetia bacterium]|nr:hypothetical protein AGMMS50267_03340 [Spirochaetia bacterium]